MAFEYLQNGWNQKWGAQQPANSLTPVNSNNYGNPYNTEWGSVFYPLKPYKRYGLKCTDDITTAIERCGAISSIISQKAFQFAKGSVSLWNPATKNNLRGEYKDWEKLFRKPNPNETQRLFFIKAYSLCQAYGYTVIEPQYPAGITDKPYRLDVLYNWRIVWDKADSDDLPPSKAYYISNRGTRRELDVSKLIIIRDSGSMGVDEYTNLPLPRYAFLEQDISNLIAALEVRGEMQTDRGANGIISNSGKDTIGPVAIPEEEKDRVQQAYKRYGNMQGQDKVIVTNSPLSYTPMTFDVKQLGSQEETIAGLKSLCNCFAFPYTALAEGFEGKYNNSSNGRRDFQDTTIDPESMDFFEQLSNGLNLYDGDVEIYMDYSGVAAVQASEEERGNGLKALAEAAQISYDLNLITGNQYLEITGQLPADKKQKNPDFDKYKFESPASVMQQEAQNNTTFTPNTANNGSTE